MKNFKKGQTGLFSFIIVFAMATLMMTSCGSDSSNNSGDAVDSNPVPTSTTPTMNDNNVQMQNSSDGTVQHYICPNNDGGGGAAQGVCPNCGEVLVHNAAFHTQDAGGDNNAEIKVNQQNTPQTPEPAQNSAGVWHYACPEGHPGAATAGTCGECGATLVHNSAYHQ